MPTLAERARRLASQANVGPAPPSRKVSQTQSSADLSLPATAPRWPWQGGALGEGREADHDIGEFLQRGASQMHESRRES